MSRLIHLAVIQPRLTLFDTTGNLARLRDGIARLREAGPLDVVLLPEVMNGWPAAMGQSAANETRQFLSETARANHVVLVGGSIGWSDDGTAVTNACFVVDRAGREVGQYAKRAPFGREVGRITPGRSDGVFEIEGLRIGVLICGDLWRPELARGYGGRIDLLCVPARTGVPAEPNMLYARTLWRGLSLTRAMENGFALAVSDWAAGSHSLEGQAHWTSGASSIVNPAARPDVTKVHVGIKDGAEGVLRATLDVAALAEFRDYRKAVGLLPGE